MSRSAGLSLAQTQAMSLLVFTGASQFAAVSIVESGGTLGAALSTGLLLASRNALYGVGLARLLRGSLPRRALASQLVIDETAAMAGAQREPSNALRAFWLTGASVFVFWNAGTLAGGALGGVIDDPEALGLDVVFPASFLALLAPQLGSRRAVGVALVAAALALPLVPLTPVGAPILIAASVASARRDLGPASRGRVVTWTAVVALAGGAYALKALGVIGLGGRPLPPRLEAIVPLIPVALLSALIVVQTLTDGRDLVLDARLPGIAVAAAAVALRAPFLLVITLAAAATALLRAVA